MTGSRRPPVRDLRSIDRLVYFSDAVFAIAITLLVLAIRIPPEGEDVGRILLDNANRFFAFALSFWVIAIFWYVHFRLFRLEPHWDHRLVSLDLLLLFAVAFLPYPTAVLGVADRDPTATAFYAGSLAFAGFASMALASYVLRVSLRGRMDPAAANRMTWVAAITPLCFLVTIPIAYVSVDVAQWLWLTPLILRIPWIDRRLGADIPFELDPVTGEIEAEED